MTYTDISFALQQERQEAEPLRHQLSLCNQQLQNGLNCDLRATSALKAAESLSTKKSAAGIGRAVLTLKRMKGEAGQPPRATAGHSLRVQRKRCSIEHQWEETVVHHSDACPVRAPLQLQGGLLTKSQSEAASTSFWACSPDGPLDDIGRQGICFRPEDRRGQQLISDIAGRRLPLAHFETPDSKQVPMYLEDGKLDVSAAYASLKYVMGGPFA